MKLKQKNLIFTDLNSLKKCLDKVAPKAHEIISLRYLKGFKPSEIASRLKRSVNGVTVALAKARTFLRQCVEQDMKTAGDSRE